MTVSKHRLQEARDKLACKFSQAVMTMSRERLLSLLEKAEQKSTTLKISLTLEPNE